MATTIQLETRVGMYGMSYIAAVVKLKDGRFLYMREAGDNYFGWIGYILPRKMTLAEAEDFSETLDARAEEWNNYVFDAIAKSADIY